MNKAKYCEQAVDTILKIAVNNIDYFREHPKHLAWVMMNYSLVGYVGRINYDACWENPKYPILDAGEKLSEEDGNLLYDAWGTSISNDMEFPDPAREPLAEKLIKLNKTLEEWIDIKTDPDYRYVSLYQTERNVINFLLCTIGTGFGWNNDGFITKTGPSNVDENIFAGYTFAEPGIRKDIRETINKLLNNKILKVPVQDYMKKVEINWNYNEVEKTILNNGWKAERKFKDQPKLLLKIREAYCFIAYLEKLIKTAIKWNDTQWNEACKKSIWEFGGYALNVSEVQPDFIYSTYEFEFNLTCYKDKINFNTDLRAINISLNARNSAWSDFVFITDDHPDVKKAQIILRKSIIKDKISKAKISKATKLLYKHQPNRNKYIDVYNRAHKGDEEAIKELNELTGMPQPGWDSVKFLVKHERKREKQVNEMLNTKNNKKKSRTYYPISEYSNMVNMPDNAHHSYVKAGIKVAQKIADNKDERPSSRKYARKFLKQWKSK